MTTRTQGTLLAGLLLALAAAAPTTGGNPAMTLRLHSTAFSDHGEIPSRYTCEGDNVSPPLDWSGVPAGARSLALVVEDPDAPDPAAPRMTWTHWLLYDLPAGTGALPEGATAAQLPAGTRVGNNDFKHAAYGGPCNAKGAAFPPRPSVPPCASLTSRTAGAPRRCSDRPRRRASRC